MVVPIFLALGAPVTLALRTLPARPRGWLLAVLHSQMAKVLAFPPLALALFVGSPWALYFSGWYEATLRSPFLHDMLHVHFVLIGCLFFWPLLGRDPVPGRVSYPLRLIVIFLTLPFHAFLGVTIMSADTLLAGSWYRSLGLDWTSPVSDQHLAGSVLWASGDIIGLLFFAVLFVQWVQDSHREAAREDRRLDRLEAVGSHRGPDR
jgi:putative copper resistance protein D